MRKNESKLRVVRRAIAAVALGACLVVGLTACAPQQSESASSGGEEQKTPATQVASLKGPTTLGMVDFMQKAEQGDCATPFEFTVAGSADEVLPKVVSGDIDIALVPANVASVLYNKTKGGVRVVDINTLGVLSVVSGDKGIDDVSDLAGRTVYMTGKGATPEYVMNYLLESAGVAKKVKLEFKSEPTEVAALLEKDSDAVAVLPQPYVTAVCAKNEKLSPVIDLSEKWDDAAKDTGSRLVTGVTVVRSEFLTNNPDIVEEFVSEQASSVKAVNDDPAAASELVAKFGIIEKAPIAQKAIPSCNLVCVTGDDMKKALRGYLDVLYGQDKASVGGKMPADDFYATDAAKS